MARLVRAVLEFNTFQPQIDFCCFRSVAINIALTHRYKLVSFLNLILCKGDYVTHPKQHKSFY